MTNHELATTTPTLDLSHKRPVARVVLIDKDNNFYLHRRQSTSKHAPNKLQLIGGKLEAVDHHRKAAICREIDEELGLPLAARDFWYLGQTKHLGWISFCFLGLLQSPLDLENIPICPDGDRAQIEQFSLSQLPKLNQSNQIAFEHYRVIEIAVAIITQEKRIHEKRLY